MAVPPVLAVKSQQGLGQAQEMVSPLPWKEQEPE